MECPVISITSYGEFSKRLYSQTEWHRIPITGSIEVTARCNLRCIHCYINQPAEDRRTKEQELSTQKIYSLIDQIADEGCLWLLFTGGEPFIRNDFIDIYTYAKKKGLLITLFTNATVITPRIADYLAEWRPYSIEISLYGRSKDTYEKVTGVAGSYERCINGIQLLLERKLPLKLKSMLMTINKHEIQDMKKYALKLGVDFRFDPLLNLRLDGGQVPESFRLAPQEVVKMDMIDEQRKEQLRSCYLTHFGPPSRPEYLYQCGAGKISFHIDARGQLSACMLSRVPSFDLYRGMFRNGWHDFLPEVLEKKWIQDVPCRKCNLISMCGQCPGWAQTEHGDQERPVEYLCRIAHQRAKAFGLNI